MNTDYKISFIAITFAVLALSACGKIDGSLSNESSNSRELGKGKSIAITAKVSNDEKMELSATKPLGAITPAAFSNFLTYTTGMGDPSVHLTEYFNMSPKFLVLHLERSKLGKGSPWSPFEFLLGLNSKGAYAYAPQPYGTNKPDYSDFNPTHEFFAGADREPLKIDGNNALAWQEQATASLKQARNDMKKYCDDNRLAYVTARKAKDAKYYLPQLPASVLLWSRRYNAIYNIMHTFENGGIFYSPQNGGFSISSTPWERVEVLDGFVSTEYASHVMKQVINESIKYKNKDFMFLRDNILQSFLSLTNENFETDYQATKLAVSQSQGGVILNNDKGVQFGSVTYVNEAGGKNTTWTKKDSGAVIYDGNTIDGTSYILTINTGSSKSENVTKDLKLSSDLKETIGSKAAISGSVSGSGAAQ